MPAVTAATSCVRPRCSRNSRRRWPRCTLKWSSEGGDGTALRIRGVRRESSYGGSPADILTSRIADGVARLASARLLEDAYLSGHNQGDMTAQAINSTWSAPAGAGLMDAAEAVPGLLGAPGRVCTVRFQGKAVTAVAELDRSAHEVLHREPITDLLALELVSGSGKNLEWARPVTVQAIVVAGRDPVRAVQRASRWASYASRVAIVPADRISEHAMAEAALRGVWLVVAGRTVQIASAGEVGPAPGSSRGLLDEVILAELRSDSAPGIASV